MIKDIVWFGLRKVYSIIIIILLALEQRLRTSIVHVKLIIISVNMLRGSELFFKIYVVITASINDYTFFMKTTCCHIQNYVIYELIWKLLRHTQTATRYLWRHQYQFSKLLHAPRHTQFTTQTNFISRRAKPSLHPCLFSQQMTVFTQSPFYRKTN